jgi:hypothetical protein
MKPWARRDADPAFVHDIAEQAIDLLPRAEQQAGSWSKVVPDQTFGST